jgi:hypothetical protein
MERNPVAGNIEVSAARALGQFFSINANLNSTKNL